MGIILPMSHKERGIDKSVVEKRVTKHGGRMKLIEIDLSRNLKPSAPVPNQERIDSLIAELRQINEKTGKSKKP